MQTTMALEDIKLTLPELLDRLTPGDEVILTRNQRVVAKLVSEPTESSTSRPRA
jgi:antitoxin (DNA-binding transcriptional repressor) of toxin-antitoxin stability system